MAQEYSDEAKRLFEAALNRDPSARADFLEESFVAPGVRDFIERMSG